MCIIEGTGRHDLLQRTRPETGGEAGSFRVASEESVFCAGRTGWDKGGLALGLEGCIWPAECRVKLRLNPQKQERRVSSGWGTAFPWCASAPVSVGGRRGW